MKKRLSSWSRKENKLINLITHSAHGGIEGGKPAQENRELWLCSLNNFPVTVRGPRAVAPGAAPGAAPRLCAGTAALARPRTAAPLRLSAPSRANSGCGASPRTHRRAGLQWHRSLKGAAPGRVGAERAARPLPAQSCAAAAPRARARPTSACHQPPRGAERLACRSEEREKVRGGGRWGGGSRERVAGWGGKEGGKKKGKKKELPL